MDQVLAHRQLWIDARRLESDAEHLADAVRLASDVRPEQEGRPSHRSEHRGQDPEQGGLAATIRSEDPEDLPGRDLERNVSQDLPIAVAVGEIADRYGTGKVGSLGQDKI